jgi:hypothetical protein
VEKGLPPLPKANLKDMSKLCYIITASKASKREKK